MLPGISAAPSEAAERCSAAMAVARSALAPANRRTALATGDAIFRSTHHCADEPSPPARIEHIPSRPMRAEVNTLFAVDVLFSRS